MGAEQQHAGGDVVDAVHHPDAGPLDLVHDGFVVDDLAQHVDVLLGAGGLQGDVDGAAHPEAEAGALGHLDLHRPLRGAGAPAAGRRYRISPAARAVNASKNRRVSV